MKKILVIMLLAILMMCTLCITTSAITMYASDGRTINIDASEIKAYKDVGWYESPLEAETGFTFDDRLYNDITYVLQNEAEKDGTRDMRFCLGFVNDDDIPDVLFSSNGGVGIFILKNRNLHQIKNVYRDGKFGQFGCIEYIPKKNKIYATFGGSDLESAFIDIEDEKIISLLDLHRYKNIYHLGDEEISQLRYYDLFNAYYNAGVEYVKVDYANMYEISVENVKKAFNEALSLSFSDKVKMYAQDGRTIDVSKEEVDTWKNVGWYDYPVRKIYTLDGRSAVVAAKDLLEYINVGWHTTDRIFMFSPNNEPVEVLLQDIPSWEANGWYQYPVTTLYATDGRTIVIPVADVEDWTNVGWYAEWKNIKMYSSDGRIEEVPIKDVTAWKKVGWFLNVQKSEDKLKREIWNFVVKTISDNLYVPGSGQFPGYNSNNVVRKDNTFEVYIEFTAMNRFGIRCRDRMLYTIKLTSTGYVIQNEKDLFE